MENKVSLNGVRLFGYHGCLKEEEHTGANFIVDAHLFLDLNPSSQTDDLDLTVDYEKALFVMKDAFDVVWETSVKHDTSLRIAAYVVAIAKVSETLKFRGGYGQAR